MTTTQNDLLTPDRRLSIDEDREAADAAMHYVRSTSHRSGIVGPVRADYDDSELHEEVYTQLRSIQSQLANVRTVDAFDHILATYHPESEHILRLVDSAPTTAVYPKRWQPMAPAAEGYKLLSKGSMDGVPLRDACHVVESDRFLGHSFLHVDTPLISKTVRLLSLDRITLLDMYDVAGIDRIVYKMLEQGYIYAWCSPFLVELVYMDYQAEVNRVGARTERLGLSGRDLYVKVLLRPICPIACDRRDHIAVGLIRSGKLHRDTVVALLYGRFHITRDLGRQQYHEPAIRAHIHHCSTHAHFRLNADTGLGPRLITRDGLFRYTGLEAIPVSLKEVGELRRYKDDLHPNVRYILKARVGRSEGAKKKVQTITVDPKEGVTVAREKLLRKPRFIVCADMPFPLALETCEKMHTRCYPDEDTKLGVHTTGVQRSEYDDEYTVDPVTGDVDIQGPKFFGLPATSVRVRPLSDEPSAVKPLTPVTRSIPLDAAFAIRPTGTAAPRKPVNWASLADEEEEQ